MITEATQSNRAKGFRINQLKGLVNKFEYFFGEDQARYLIEINDSNLTKVKKILKENSVSFDELGAVSENKLEFDSEINLTIDDLNNAYKDWLRKYMVN